MGPLKATRIVSDFVIYLPEGLRWSLKLRE
jgi:hypothetical protein